MPPYHAGTRLLRSSVVGIRARALGSPPCLSVQGHGRTGLFALAVLLSAGVTRSVEDDLRMLKAVRPGIRLSRDQHRCIQMYGKYMA